MAPRLNREKEQKNPGSCRSESGERVFEPGLDHLITSPFEGPLAAAVDQEVGFPAELNATCLWRSFGG